MTDSTPSSILALSTRRAMLEEPGLGAGTFLRYALEYNPHPDVPFVHRQDIDEQGVVRLSGHSLRDLAAIRDTYARWYWANGVRPGDPVGVYVSEGLEPFLQFLGLTALGAIPAMMNNNMPLEIVPRYLAHLGAVGVVTDDVAAVRAALGEDAAGGLRFIVSSAELRSPDAAEGELPSRYPYEHGDDDVVALIHSSGTTGMPKATIVGHRQFWVGRKPRVLAFPSERDDRVLSALPHTHAAGISYLMNSVLTGVPIVAMADWRRRAVEPTMAVYQPSVVVAFPRTYVELATGELPVAAAARVHTWISTGDRAHDAHVRRLVQLGRRPATGDGQPARAGSRFNDGLGSSELGMSLFQQITTPESPRDDCCIGRPIDVVERVAVLAQSGAELPDGTPGLLGVVSPTRTPGYWRAPDLNSRHELAGYWLSGDVVRRAADGRFYHLDRSVDVITTATGPVYSLPVEEVLLADCAELVLDCSVVGVPGPAGDQRPVAVIVSQPGVTEPDGQELLDTLNKALSAANLPSLDAAVIAEDERHFPTGATGKVLKRELRERLANLLTGENTPTHL